MTVADTVVLKTNKLPVFDLEQSLKNHISPENDHFVWNDIFRSVRFVPLDNAGPSLYSDIRVFPFGENIAVLSARVWNHTLGLYDRDGHFITGIGHVGHGPYEYVLAKNVMFDIADSSVYIHDMVMRRVIGYDFCGNGTAEIPLENDVNAVCMAGDVFVCKHDLKEKPSFRLDVMDRNGGFQKRFLPVKIDFHIPEGGVFSEFLERNGKDILFYSSLLDTVYRVTADTVMPCLVLKRGNFAWELKRALTEDMQFYEYDHPFILYRNIKIGGDYVYLSYVFRGKQYNDIWNRVTGNLLGRRSVSALSDENKIIFYPYFFYEFGQANKICITPVYADEKYFYFVLQPLMSVVRELLPGVQEDDNPVLMIAEIN